MFSNSTGEARLETDVNDRFFQTFFRKFFNSKDAEQFKLYKKLIDLHFGENEVQISDDLIELFFEEMLQTGQRPILDQASFNRTLLHACICHPKAWSEKFTIFFNWLMNSGVVHSASLPEDFVKQLEWLQYYSAALKQVPDRNENIANILAAKPLTLFPLFALPDFPDGYRWSVTTVFGSPVYFDLFNSIRATKLPWVDKPKHFTLFKYFEREECVALFNDLYSLDILSEIVEKADSLKDLRLLLGVLYQYETTRHYYEKVFWKLIPHIRTVQQFNELMHDFDFDQCMLLNSYFDVTSVVACAVTFVRALEGLPLEKRVILWKRMREELPEMIVEFDELEHVLYGREAEAEMTHLCSALKDQLPGYFTSNPANFFFACAAIADLSSSSPARIIFIRALKDIIPSIINEENIGKLNDFPEEEMKLIRSFICEKKPPVPAFPSLSPRATFWCPPAPVPMDQAVILPEPAGAAAQQEAHRPDGP